MTDEMITTDVLVIGAGPAGLAAAAETAASGLDVTVVDENVQAGGQIGRQRLPRGSRADGAHDDPLVPTRVRFLPASVCVGIGPGDEAVLARGGALVTVRWRALLLATGAIEQVLPLPGWTTPGVMSAGAAQAMLKSSGRFPFERVVVAGSGPLLLAASAQLVRAGVRVEAVAEAHRLGAHDLRAVPGLVWGGRVLGEGAAYLATLLRARVPLLTGHAVREVAGTLAVEAADLAPVERDWSFRPGAPSRRVPCDAVVLSHGFSSNVELAVAAGVRLVWDEVADTWRPWRGTTLATTRRGVWAAGDCAGVSGGPVARAEGAVAGLAIAAWLGADPGSPRRRRTLARRLSRLERFHAALEQWARRQAGAATWRTADTVVCRCQETTAEEIEAAIATGASSLSAVKLWTRAGMGRCQGRTCRPVLRSMLRDYGGLATCDDTPSIRFPVRPVVAGAVAAWPALRENPPPLVAPPGSGPDPHPHEKEAS